MKDINKSYIRTILLGLVFLQLFFGGFSQEGLAENCDYIVFIHEDLFCNAVDDLIDYRENHGYNVCLDTVYDNDTFNNIKDMISDYYDPESNAVQPLCVLLIGDAAGFDTLWMVTNSEVGNYIPSYWETYPLPHRPDYMFAIDELYVCIDDGEPAFMNGSLFPDVYLGRIPASDTHEVTVYINKLFDYEDNESLQEWKDNVLLIAGDSLLYPPPPATCPPEEVNDESELIVNEIVPGDWESKILYYSDAPVAARQDSLANNINSGQLIVSTLGTIADHFNLCWYVFRYSIGDVPPFDAQVQLENYPMYPVLLGASCEMSRIDSFNYSGTENFYENFLLTDSAGAICWIGATGPTRQKDDFAFTETFYHSIFDNGILDVGRLNYVTKLNSIKDHRAGLFTIKQFCVYGDPAMMLSANPGFAPIFTGTSFELTDPRVFQNKIHISQNITNPNARIIPEQYSAVTPYGQRTYKIAGNDSSSDSSKIFWELLNDTIPINQERRYLTFFMYVVESPGDLRRIYIDAIVDSSNWLHEYDVYDQYGHGVGAKNVPSEPGSWKYYALDLSDIYGSDIEKILVRYDDGGDTCTGNFKAYFDEIKFMSTWGNMPVIVRDYHPYTLGIGKDDTLSVIAYDLDVLRDFGDTTYYEWSSTLGTLINENTRKPTYMAPDSIIGDEPIDTIICNVSDNGLNINADTMYIYYGPDGGIIYDGHGGPLIWNEYANPYYMLGDVEVPTGCTLTLNGGALIKFGDGIELKVNGSLQTEDNVAYTVLLTSLSNSGPGDWKGVLVLKGGSSSLSYCKIKYAVDAITVLNGSQIYLDHCEIFNSKTSGITCTYPERVRISNTRFLDNNLYAISIVNADDCAEFYGNLIEGNHNDGIKYFGGTFGRAQPEVYGNVISGGSSVGIYIEKDQPDDMPQPQIMDDTISNFGVGIVLFDTYEGTHIGPNVVCDHNYSWGLILERGYADILGKEGAPNSFSFNVEGIWGVDNAGKVRLTRFEHNIWGGELVNSYLDFGTEDDKGLNSFEGNTEFFLAVYDSPEVFAQLNWWGTKDPDEIREKVTELVIWEPFLEEPPDWGKGYANDLNLPDKLELFRSYPNPFNTQTRIEFGVPNKTIVTIKIYNMLGQEIRELYHKETPPGFYSIIWDGKDKLGNPVASGVYLYSLRTPDEIKTKKMVLLK